MSQPRDQIWVVGFAGGSGSGKTTLASELVRELGPDRCLVLAQDHYYIDQSHRFDGDGGSVNFDAPSSIEFSLLASHIRQLASGCGADVPVYDFPTHKRLARTQRFEPRPFVIVEGTLILNDPGVRESLNASYFIETSEQVRFERRLRRDTQERGRTAQGVHRQFTSQVKPMHDRFVEPSKRFADQLVSGEITIAAALREILAGPRLARPLRGLRKTHDQFTFRTLGSLGGLASSGTTAG